MQQTFQRSVVNRFIGGASLNSPDFQAVGEVHDFLLSDIPASTARRGFYAKESAALQIATQRGDVVVLVPMGEFATL